MIKIKSSASSLHLQRRQVKSTRLFGSILLLYNLFCWLLFYLLRFFFNNFFLFLLRQWLLLLLLRHLVLRSIFHFNLKSWFFLFYNLFYYYNLFWRRKPSFLNSFNLFLLFFKLFFLF